MLNGDIPSVKDEEGYWFVDRNGVTFGTLLDYMRTGVLSVPFSVPTFKGILLEADFFSIDLGPAFCDNLVDGLYSESFERGLFYIERSSEQPWCFGITGILREEIQRKFKWTELWREVKKKYHSFIIIVPTTST